MDDETSFFSEITPYHNTQTDTQTDGRTRDDANDDDDDDDDIPSIGHSKTNKAHSANKANKKDLFDSSDEDSVNNNNKHVKTKIGTTEKKRKRLEKDNEKNILVVENKQSRAMESSSNSNSRHMDISNRCIIPGCQNLSRIGGLCGYHGGRKKAICSVDGCTKVARSTQLRCWEHRILNFNVDSNSNNGTDSNSKDDAKVKKQIKKDCKFPGCNKKSRGAHGFCVKHQREHNNQNPSSPLVPSVSPLAKVSKQIQDAQNKHDALERRLKGLADKLMKLKERKARLITLNSAVPTYKMGEKNTIVIPTLKEGGNDIHEAAQSFSVEPTCITGEIRTMQLNDKCNKELGNNFDDKVGILGARGVLKPNEDKLTTEDELQQPKNALDTGIQDIVSVLMLITMA
jgi:hypothetical protein